jgi:hypothetical protein
MPTLRAKVEGSAKEKLKADLISSFTISMALRNNLDM